MQDTYSNKSDFILLPFERFLDRIIYFTSIIVQRDATQSSLFIILRVHSACFRCQPHPSSGVHKTGTTATGTGHVILCSYLPPTWPSGHAWPRWREVAAPKI